MAERCKHERQRQAPGERTRHGGRRFKLQRGSSAGPQPGGPGRTRQLAPSLMHVRNTSGTTRSTWASFARAARADARISQAELARRLGIDRTTIYRWEAGTTRPESPEMVVMFAVVLDIDPEEAMAAAGLRPGIEPPTKPTREPDEELDLVATDPQLSDEMKERVITIILERRAREKATAIEETRRMIELLRREN